MIKTDFFSNRIYFLLYDFCFCFLQNCSFNHCICGERMEELQVVYSIVSSDPMKLTVCVRLCVR